MDVLFALATGDVVSTTMHNCVVVDVPSLNVHYTVLTVFDASPLTALCIC